MDPAQALSTLGIEAETKAPGPPGGQEVARSLAEPVRVSTTLAERVTGKTLSYDQLVDELLLSPPGETQRALAKRVGYSESWLSRIIASDAFQVRLSARIEKDVEPERREILKLRFASIEEEARVVLMESLKKLSDRLQNPAGVSDELVLRSAAVTSKLLGYGARKETPPPAVNLHVHLQELADNVRNLNRSPSAVGRGPQDAHVPVTIDHGEAAGPPASRGSLAPSGDSK